MGSIHRPGWPVGQDSLPAEHQGSPGGKPPQKAKEKRKDIPI